MSKTHYIVNAGGGSADPIQNQTLAAVIKRARAQGVPKDNIENALKKAAGGKDKGDQQVTYEAMAAGSVGIVIECLTNNVNRTLHSIRDILTSHGARFAPVGFLFERKGSVRVSLQRGEDYSERLERLIETALEADAEDFEESDSGDVVEVEFICPPSTLSKVTEAVTSRGLADELIGSELVYQPVDAAEPPDEQLESKISNIVDALEENEDTLRVWTTLD
ncbi:hypothetical protein NLI96_g8884 [Meripilus lineatus]|uniref:Transcriptional regulatory protein n=1 Tax=Meripilus lineatus TaxID=2056292 RepID=A0AAD5YBL2_9APHY|nr:hypothetical protein NLI96_g8884 [Physisporinus lineatus]